MYIDIGQSSSQVSILISSADCVSLLNSCMPLLFSLTRQDLVLWITFQPLLIIWYEYRYEIEYSFHEVFFLQH